MTNWTPNSNKFQVVIQSNSPGEISSWVRPFVRTLLEHKHDCDITVFLTPCQFSSGQEKEIAMSIPGVTQALSPKETIKFMYQRPLRFNGINGIVVYLGGDPLYAKLLAFKLKLQVIGYAEHKSLLKGFKKGYWRQEDGDLMAKKISYYKHDHQHPIEKTYALFFTGSRPKHFDAFFPFLSEVIGHIKKTKPDFPAVINISPFISDEKLNSIKQKHKELTILKQDSLALMNQAKLLISLPGTSTAEANFMGLPMFVMTPLNRPDLIILTGLAGFIEKIPVLGISLKKLILFILKQRKNYYYAQPNFIAKKEIVPEVVGHLNTEEMAKRIKNIFYDQKGLEKQKESLSNLPKQADVASEMVHYILKEIL